MSWLLLPILLLLAAGSRKAPPVASSSPPPPAPAVSLRGQPHEAMPEDEDRQLRAVLAAVTQHHASEGEP